MKKLFLMPLLMSVLFSVKAQIGYEKSIELGASIGLDKFTKSSFEIGMINGYRFNDYLSLGAGVGFRYTDALYYQSFILPCWIQFAKCRIYIL
ncbi:MAG: outer membrane protein transport protein [Dysgonamonadaceae bacterium]|nr:outer membrane protein transport protein [Dysgonamonadaceae bacterium]